MAASNIPVRLSFQTLLVATDFSANTEAVVACASAIARKSGGKLILAHVMSPARWQLVPPEDLHPALCQSRREVQKKMAGVLKSEKLRGVQTEAVLKEGELREVLCKLAHERMVELLVVGTKGRKGLSKLLLGSTAEEVCNVAPCPVILVGPKAQPNEECTFGRVLFPTDLGGPSLGALPVTLALAEQHGSRLHFVRAVDSNQQAQESILSELRQQLSPVLARYPVLDQTAEYSVRVGATAKVIIDAAVDWKADLIAIGSYRPGALAAHLPGDLVYDVVCDAFCPVLTICD